MTGINKYQGRIPNNGFCAVLALGSLIPGLAAKAPTGISQEGSQLARDFMFACVLYMKASFSQGTKKAWEVLFPFRGRHFAARHRAANLTWSHVLFLNKLHTYTHRVLEVAIPKELGWKGWLCVAAWIRP